MRVDAGNRQILTVHTEYTQKDMPVQKCRASRINWVWL